MIEKSDVSNEKQIIKFIWRLPPDLYADSGNVFFNVVFYNNAPDGTINQLFGTSDAIAIVKNRFESDKEVTQEQQKSLLEHFFNDVKIYTEQQKCDLSNSTVEKKEELAAITELKKVELDKYVAEKENEIQKFTEEKRNDLEQTTSEKKNEIKQLLKGVSFDISEKGSLMITFDNGK